MSKKVFNIEDYDETYVMHCKTKEDAIVFTEYLCSIGKRWCSHEDYTPYNTSWENYKEQTCYEFVGGTFCDLPYFIQENYHILNFEDFEFKDLYEIGDKDNTAFDEFISEFRK